AALGEVNREYHGVAPGGDLDQLQLAVDRLTTTGHADGQGVVVEQVVGELDTVFVDPQRDRGVGDGDPDLIGGQLAPLDGVAQHVAPDDGDLHARRIGRVLDGAHGVAGQAHRGRDRAERPLDRVDGLPGAELHGADATQVGVLGHGHARALQADDFG